MVMKFRSGEDAFFYFPVIDEDTNTPVIVTDAVATWVCGKTVGDEFTPELVLHTGDPTQPIIATTDPDDMGGNLTQNTFRVLVTHNQSGGLLGTYDYELAMLLGTMRIVLYPPVDGIAQFTVLPSLTWDAVGGEPRLIRAPPARISMSQPEPVLEPEPEPETKEKPRRVR